MKKLTLAVLAVAIMGTTTLAQADTRTASAVASWDAKAYKVRYSPMSRPNNHKIKIELGW